MGTASLLALLSFAIASVALYMSVFRIKKSRQALPKWEDPPTGFDESGKLTIFAKEAIREYMLSLLTVGGTIIAIVAGIAGYMINDLAKARALSDALNKIQAPLVKQLGKIGEVSSEANSALKSVKELQEVVKKPEFVSDVAGRLSENSDLKQQIQNNLVKNVTNELLEKHTETIRGKKGDPGDDGASPKVKDVAAALVNNYHKQLRGQDGIPGKNGIAPDGAVVAFALPNGCPKGWSHYKEARGKFILGTGRGVLLIRDREDGAIKGQIELGVREYGAEGSETIQTSINNEVATESKQKSNKNRPLSIISPYIALHFCKKN